MQENRNQINKDDSEKQALKKNPGHKYKPGSFEVILILLLLFLLGMLIWSQKQLNYLRKDLNQHQMQMAELKKDLSDTKNHIQDQAETLEKVQHQAIAASHATPIEQPQDITYLVRLAHQHLILHKDRDQALKALYMAKAQAASLEKGEALRGAIQHDIQALESINPPKQEEVIEQLFQLAQKTQKLTLIHTFSVPETLYPASELTNLNYWEKFKRTMLNLLKKAVVVTHEVKDSISSFTPNHTYLTSQLQLIFSRAQWAVFLKQQDVYRSSLEQAAKLIQQYYVQNKDTKEMLDQIDRLKSISIDPALPDLSHLLNIQVSDSTSKPASDSNKNEKKQPADKMPGQMEQGVLTS